MRPFSSKCSNCCCPKNSISPETRFMLVNKLNVAFQSFSLTKNPAFENIIMEHPAEIQALYDDNGSIAEYTLKGKLAREASMELVIFMSFISAKMSRHVFVH